MPADGAKGFAVVLTREDGSWTAGLLPDRLVHDLDGLLHALRQQPPGEVGPLALVDVADEFFVAVRVRGDGVRLLLSDVTAAVAWPLADQALAYLGVAVPDEEDLDDILPAGDLSIFGDLGLDEMELGAVLADTDAYADEILSVVVGRLGFAAVYDQAIESALH